MKAAKALMMGLGASGGAAPGGGLYVDDVFSAYTYAGNGSAQTIINGIDLAGHGGMVWLKSRNASYDHQLFDTSRGVQNQLSTNSTGQSTNVAAVTAFNPSGFSLGGQEAGVNFASWTFRNAPRFYGHQVVTKLSGSNRTVNFPELVTLGMVRVKRTDATGSWYVWHRSLPSGQLLIGETTNVAATLGHITVSGTSVTLVNGVIADGTYLVEAWAHDEALDGIVQCGSFTTDAGGNATVNLGWEPQYLLVKESSTTGQWIVVDIMRGWIMPSGTGGDARLYTNQSLAENGGQDIGNPTPTGFTISAMTTSSSFIYLAIRRPNKPPTSGTQVYNAIARTGTGVATTIAGVGFAPDLAIPRNRLSPSNEAPSWYDRVRGASFQMTSNSNGVEIPRPDTLTGFDVMDGVRVGSDTEWVVNKLGSTYINHYFRRAPGFMDVTPDTGTGSAHTIQHNLTSAPQLMIRKARGATTPWEVWHSAMAANEHLVLSSTAARATDATAWNNTVPTNTTFSVGTAAATNASGIQFVTYLFGTLPGISKIGSYTGNGGSQAIACGFTTGARFVLIKRIDTAGDWYIWDTARGILPANDPHLSLNTAAAEVTTDDSIDPDSAGFVVNQNTATNINVTGGSYIFMAIA